MTPAQARNNDKYCEYHKDKGHTTKDCRALAKVLAEREKINPPQINLIEKPGPSKTIFVIWSSPLAKRSSDQSIKKLKLNQEPIRFLDEDLEGIEVPHQNPLVISAEYWQTREPRLISYTGIPSKI